MLTLRQEAFTRSRVWEFSVKRAEADRHRRSDREIIDQQSCSKAVFQINFFSINVNYEMEAVIQIHRAYVTL